MTALSPDAPAVPSINRQLWAIALPAMLTNVATALFGLADMWAIGRLGDASAQGAVELGAKFMLGLLNVFNFLRTSTVALTAQGAGRGDGNSGETLARAMAVGLAIGTALLLAMPLAVRLGLDLLGAQGPVREAAQSYVAVRYWAAPLWLANCVLTGWLIGQRRVRSVLVAEIAANVFHIGLDLLLVLVVGWGVAGVAVATVSSEALKFALLGVVVIRAGAAREAVHAVRRRSTWARAELARLFALNRDLFIRTLLLTGSILLFARIGARAGSVTLAANGVLFQLFMLATLLLDGFESGAQVLCGEALGAGSRARFTAAVRAALVSGGVTGLALSAIYAAAGPTLAAAFSTDPAVIGATARYAPWLAVLPVIGVSSFVFDGVFVGAGWTRAMLTTMGVAMVAYLALLAMLQPLGNHGLWAAFAVLFGGRAVGQALVLPRLVRRSFRPS